MTSVPAANGAKLSVTERMARLLGVIPWVVEQGGAHLDDIAARFDYPSGQLLEDLTQRLFFVGVHPFTPDTLIEVHISDGIVDIQYADWFSKPMQLTGEEATRLLAAGRTVLDMSSGQQRRTDGEDAAEPLVRALTKLSLSLGSGDGGAADRIDVCLGHASTETLDELRLAINARRRIEIEYYSQGRDAMTVRMVDPARLLSHDGAWYLFGWCHRARAERVFRVDRIRALTVTQAEAKVDAAAARSTPMPLDGVERTVTLRLDPEAAWAADYYRARHRTEHSDGTVEAEFAVANESWLARLLVQLGPQAEMLDKPESVDADLRAATAARILERYRQ